MSRIMVVLVTGVLSISISVAISGRSPAAREVTFSKDIAPILFRTCVECHRPGGIGPFSVLTFKDVRPWAKSIKQDLLSRRPHWPLVISREDIQIIAAWADTGSKEGNPADMPSEPQFPKDWQIGIPDLVVSMQRYRISARDPIPDVTLPTDYVFPEDKWVQAIEIRPSNVQVVDHAVALVKTEGGATNALHLYSPGVGLSAFRQGYGKLIPKGARLSLQMRYQAIGKETTDQTRVGIKFAKGPVHTTVRTELVTKQSLSMPLLDHPEVLATYTLPVNARIHSVRAHTHLPGKNSTATLVRPDGSRQVLLSVPVAIDFWRYYFILEPPVDAPKGSVVEFVAKSNNSTNPSSSAPKPPIASRQPVSDDTCLIFVDWTEINQNNRDDFKVIHIPPSRLPL
jgi:hypothetical protein